MRFEIRPLGPWLLPVTKNRRSSAVFRATWDDTFDMLCYETDRLGASLIVLEVEADPGDVRRDGMLRAKARVGFPGVRVSFTSRHGPLTYATDAYDNPHDFAGYRGLAGWQANVRAIALGLEALRAVDRYGITRSGEQYQGWQALPQRPHEMTPAEAAEFIAHWAAGEMTGLTGATLLANPAMLTSAYRAAARATHPDRTGDSDTFARINVARDLLTKEGANHR